MLVAMSSTISRKRATPPGGRQRLAKQRDLLEQAVDAGHNLFLPRSMRDRYGNTTDLSESVSASTTSEVDDQPPTPNAAQFEVDPGSHKPQELTMTSVVGTDENGPVEYYFTETSGNLGAQTVAGSSVRPTQTAAYLKVRSIPIITMREIVRQCYYSLGA